MQNRIPIISSRWPSMPRNETEERSGSLRPPSPLDSGAGWAQAADAPKVIMARMPATAVVRVLAKRHPRDTISASQVRIANPPLIENYIKDDYGFRLPRPGTPSPAALIAERGSV